MADVKISGYIPGAIGRVIELHGTYYHTHWGFGAFFETLVAKEMAEFLKDFDETRDGFWIATVDGQVAGSISICGQEADTNGARLRWFIVDPNYQGHGAGKRLMEEAIGFCLHKNFKRIYLTTFAGLDAARHLYEKWGFTLYEEHEGDHWGTKVTEQAFERML